MAARPCLISMICGEGGARASGVARARRGDGGWRGRGSGARLVAAHVAGLDQAERVVHAERREDAEVALGEHGDRRRAGGRGAHGGRVERESGDGGGKHDLRRAARREVGGNALATGEEVVREEQRAMRTVSIIEARAPFEEKKRAELVSGEEEIIHSA